MECKYWMLVEEMDIKEEFSYNMSPKDKREVRKIPDRYMIYFK